MKTVKLLEQGLTVLKPVGDRLPYDIAVDVSGQLVRIQVRTAYKTSFDTFSGNTRSIRTNRKRYRIEPANTKDVEFFIFVLAEINECYVVPSYVVKKYASRIVFGQDHKHEQFRNNFGAVGERLIRTAHNR